jgi:hypothetical protein
VEIRPGDIVRLKKEHPCGGDRWQVERVGADIGLRCLNCQHHILLKRSTFERRVKEFISRGAEPEAAKDRESEIEAELADLKGRWPPHSVPPSMWMELERLEEELEQIKRERQARTDAE